MQRWELFKLADVPVGAARGFSVGEGDWPFRGILVRTDAGVFAYVNACAHLRHPLNLGRDDFLSPDGSLLRCASHGALFELETGYCVAGPCAGQGLAELPCGVDGEMVWVEAPASMRDINLRK